MLTACTPTYTDAPGTSTLVTAQAELRSTQPREVEPLFARARTFQAAALEPSRSTGHLFDEPGVLLTVRVDPGARATYLSWTAGAEVSPGTVVLATHASRGRELDAYLMEKLAPGRWRFQRLTREGHRLPTEAELCQRCHVDAVSDFLFGLPRMSIPRLPPPTPGDAGSEPQKNGDPEG